MRLTLVLWILVSGGLLRAQDGQAGSRPGWPCVPGRAVDPSYLEVSESTGGQLFLFQKNEISQASPVMSASFTHPATVLRAVGTLSGTRDFEFPIDSSVESMLVLVSLQCRNAIQVSRPSGSELTQANSALSVDLQAGRILRVDQPEPGPWRVRITGTGLFVLSVLVKAQIGLAGVNFFANGDRLTGPLLGVRQSVEARISGTATGVRVRLVDAGSSRISELEAEQGLPDDVHRAVLVPAGERFRILVTGTDSSAWPFQRTYPVLFRAESK